MNNKIVETGTTPVCNGWRRCADDDTPGRKCNMYKYSFTNNGKTWERITKKQARDAYNNGLTVLFCPVYVRPFAPWHLEIDVNKNFEGYNGVSFEKAVNAFEYYNCINNETGRYTAFYIPSATLAALH